MKYFWKRGLTLCLIIALAACSTSEEAALETLAKKGSLPALNTLAPGETLEIAQDLGINVVFVGFDDTDVNTRRVAS